MRKKEFKHVGNDLSSLNRGACFSLSLFGGLIFLNGKHLKKQKGYFAELQQSLKKGQKIKLYGGIIGEIQALGKETVDLRVKSGTVIEVERSAVAEIMQ